MRNAYRAARCRIVEYTGALPGCQMRGGGEVPAERKAGVPAVQFQGKKCPVSGIGPSELYGGKKHGRVSAAHAQNGVWSVLVPGGGFTERELLGQPAQTHTYPEFHSHNGQRTRRGGVGRCAYVCP